MAIVAPGFRLPVYILLWIVAAVLLGLTAARVDFTNKNFGTHEQVVVELLVASVLCLLWVPFSLLALIWNRPSLLLESLGILVLYTLFLAGAAIPSVLFPTAGSGVVCGAGPVGRQCGIEKAIVGFAWTAWTLTFLLLVLVGLERAPGWGSNPGLGAGSTGTGHGVGRKGGWGYGGRTGRAPAAV